MPYKDPQMRKAYFKKYHRDYYTKNYEQERERIRQVKEGKRVWMLQYKAEHGCSKCGAQDVEQLEFYYVMPIFTNRCKHKTVGSMISDGRAIQDVIDALKDFVLLCRGCRYGYNEIYERMGM